MQYCSLNGNSLNFGQKSAFPAELSAWPGVSHPYDPLPVNMMIKSISDAKLGKAAGHVPTGEAMHDGIALRLRELYSDLENEGIPDNLLHLLEKLDEAERAQSMTQKTED